MLRGRRDERAGLDGLLDDARTGRSGVLVLRGEAGIGKTALLEHASESASDFRLLRAVGVESEMELAFAALHQLCAPVVDLVDRLPAPQRDALEITFGVSAGAAPDRFLVAVATLSLFSEAAQGRPLLCVIDDAQWLDRASAQALGFVARRLLAEPVVLLFGARETTDAFAGLPELLIEGLAEAEARKLLLSVIAGRLDDRVADQLVAEARGNPLALVELPRGLSPAQLAGGFGLPAALSLAATIEQSFLQRLEALPSELLVAAAEPLGDPAVLWSAAQRLGITGSAREPAESAGLIEIDDRVRFRHPLVRSAVYRAASAERRRRVHRALADATDAETDPDRRAWHLAEATAGPDEDVASELERAAARAQARGGVAAAAAFLQRAAALTPEPGPFRPAGVCGGADQLRSGRARRGSCSTGHRRDGRRRRLRACRRATAACSDRVRGEAWERCAAAAAQGGPGARSSRPAARARHLPGRLGRRAVRRPPGAGCQHP
jgi:hypothetical protein